ncbi:MAG: heme-degrading domain-containing protein [Rhodobacteraceae bacterium]|nr:heme-degrading domain-containing protein [Paracoccaceae bacterium]
MDEISTLKAEATELVLPAFDEAAALDLGARLVALARAGALPVVIDIRTPDRTLFHAALPGSAPLNDLWARRKSATALVYQQSSLLVGLMLRAKGDTLAQNGLDPADHADHGGAVPIRVAGTGVVAVATVSGLPSREDHALVVQALRAIRTQG